MVTQQKIKKNEKEKKFKKFKTFQSLVLESLTKTVQNHRVQFVLFGMY